MTLKVAQTQMYTTVNGNQIHSFSLSFGVCSLLITQKLLCIHCDLKYKWLSFRYLYHFFNTKLGFVIQLSRLTITRGIFTHAFVTLVFCDPYCPCWLADACLLACLIHHYQDPSRNWWRVPSLPPSALHNSIVQDMLLVSVDMPPVVADSMESRVHSVRCYIENVGMNHWGRNLQYWIFTVTCCPCSTHFVISSPSFTVSAALATTASYS